MQSRSQLRLESSGLVSREPSLTLAKRAAGTPPTILLVVWPEYGHVVTPLALAKQLRSAGYRVVFAGVRTFEQPMRKLGYEYVTLAESRADGAPTLFDFLPDHSQFCAALAVFVEVFRAALAAHRPSLILFDSLYSAFGIIASDAGVAWAIYETDLPREYDPGVPPPHLMQEPGPQATERIQAEWNAHLERSYAYLAYADSRPDLGRAWATAYFPRILTRALQDRFGTTVPFDTNTLYAPVAKVPRMVFCPEAFDFDRVNRAGTHWVGPCIDYERREPDFAWDSLPANRRIAYCALGTQSARQPNAVKALRTVLEVFSARDDYFLVLVCNRHQKNELPRAGSSVMLVERAPQLALLRRASVALIHGGFNSLKECAALGVPVIALPLGMDQPRNAALARHHGFAIALDVNRLTRSELDDAVSAVDSDPVRQACARMKSLFAEAAAEPLALRFVEAMLATLENGIERA